MPSAINFFGSSSAALSPASSRSYAIKTCSVPGLTQVQLAAATRTTQRTISYYETVAEYPTVPVLIALAKALGVSADELLGLKPPPKSASSSAPAAAPEEKRLWKKLRQVAHAHLPERDQRAVIRLINSVAASREKSA
jgi:transcriptional regulator with XRE-family HTH domain